MLGCAGKALRLNLPYPIPFPERVRKRTCSNHGLPLDRYSESPCYHRIGGRALDIPESHFVGEVLVGHVKVLAPFLDVSEPIGGTIRVQPAIGRNPVDDDRGVLEDAEEQIVVLRVEPIDVGIDERLDFLAEAWWPRSSSGEFNEPLRDSSRTVSGYRLRRTTC